MVQSSPVCFILPIHFHIQMLRLTFFALLFLLFTSCTIPGSEPAKVYVDSWVRDSTAHFKLQAQVGVRSADSLKSIGQKMEKVQKEILALLNDRNPQKLQLYFLKDRATLASYTGYSAKGYTDTHKGILYFVDQDPFHLPLKHETAHALSWRLWGTPKEYWISEGLAVFANKACGGYNLHVLANALYRHGKLVPFQNLVDSFDFRALEPSLQAASVVQYIYDTYGVAALKAFWQKGWASSHAIIDLPATTLEQQWKAWIAKEQFRAPVNWENLKTHGCE